MVIAILFATHRGEFWPFSTFPMFSHAGRLWTRTLVRDITRAAPASWTDQELAGSAFALSASHIEQNDLAMLVARFGDRLEAEHARMIAAYFDGVRAERRLLLYVAEPALDRQRRVSVRYTPIVVIDGYGARPLGAGGR